jgi:hypothetical protein
MKASSALKALLIVFALLVVGQAAFIAYAAFERPFLTYENLPFPTQTTMVKAGEVVPLMVRRCNNTSTTRVYLVTHELERLDALQPNVILLAEPVPIQPGCTTGASRVNRIPAGTPPGKYRLVGAGIIEGSLRMLTVPWQSQPFEVVP